MKWFFSLFKNCKQMNENQKNYNTLSNDYSKIGLDSTLLLAYRDIPDILNKYLFSKNVKKNGYKLLDYGCGPGVSTQIFANYFKEFNVKVNLYGVDVNKENLKIALKNVPEGVFSLIAENKLPENMENFDVVVCNFVLLENKFSDMVSILKTIQKTMHDDAILIVTNCTAKVYNKKNKWYTSENDFPENEPTLKCMNSDTLKLVDGQTVKAKITDKSTLASFIVTDFFHSGGSYRRAYKLAGLNLIETIKPLGKDTDGIEWKSEKEHPPYKIHILYKCTEENTLQNERSNNNNLHP